MSRETAQWRLINFLVGFVLEHGLAWHGTKGAPNMFDGPVPLERVQELFDWDAEKRPIYVMSDEPTITPDGELTTTQVPLEVPGRFAVSDSRDISNVFQVVSKIYKVHQYRDWLLENVATLLDVDKGNLLIGSAGLMQNGGQAWVQVRPNVGISIGGDVILPWLLASTSHNGSLVTGYKGAATRAVCDNTFSMALRGPGHQFTVRHTTNSLNRLSEAREAIGMFYEDAENFAREVEQMMNTTVTDQQFRQLVDRLEPEAPADATDQMVNSANNRRGTLLNLWANDARVGEYKGSVWGAINAFNTKGHWETGGPTSKTAERQMKRTAGGEVERTDRQVLNVLDEILVDA